MKPRTSKLPLWATVKSAYRLVWSNRIEYVKISRWWLMLAIPIVYVYNWMIWTSIQPTLCFARIKANNEQHIPPNNEAFLTLPPELFLLLFGASIAVAWHRLILRNERITTNRYLRFDGVVWSYFIFAVFLRYLPSLSDLFDLWDTDHQASGMLIIKGIGMVVVIAATMLIAIRLSVMLPAKALALKEVTIKDVWERTHSNFWRLFIGGFLCILPVVPIAVIIQPGCNNDLTGVTLYTVSRFLYIVIAMPVELAFLSLSYQHFFGKDRML